MTRKQEVIRALKNHNGGADTLIKEQIAEFFGTLQSGNKKKRTNRGPVKRLTEGVPAFEGKYYLVSDIAEAYIRKEEIGGVR